MKITYDKCAFAYLILLLIYILLGSILYCYALIDSMIFSNILIVFGIVGLVLYIVNKFKVKRLFIHDIFVMLLIIFGFFSFYYSYIRYVALLGFKSGREGLLVIVTYYIIFLVSTTLKNKDYKKWCINILTIIGLLNVFYGILQGLDLESYLPIVGIYGYPSGFFSNSNFYGSFMTIMCGIYLTKFLYNSTFHLKYFLLFNIFLLGLLLSGAMSAFVGFLFMLFFLFFLYIFMKKKNKNIIVVDKFKKIILLLASFLVLLFVVNALTNVEYISDVQEMGNEIVSSVNGEIDENMGSGRLYIWKESMRYFTKYNYWNTGIGIDNFMYIGNGKLIIDSNSGDIIYKAHNEYLQILVCEGIFKLLVYLSFLGYIFFKAISYLKSNKVVEKNYLALFIAFCGYCVQAFFNISITRVAPIFYMIAGLIVGEFD